MRRGGVLTREPLTHALTTTKPNSRHTRDILLYGLAGARSTAARFLDDIDGMQFLDHIADRRI